MTSICHNVAIVDTPVINKDPIQTADLGYQDIILQDVSRTFALTIPQLPKPLSIVVGNAYLLCRIADTVEDDKDMNADRKRLYSERFIKVVKGEQSANEFSSDLRPLLSSSATAAEKDLIEHVPTVIRITHGFNQTQRAALERCVAIMAEGMARYQEQETLDGLKDQAEMDQYCYYVAGVVGEMLTQLFCDYSEEINQHSDELMQLSVSFGQGLQMTNILKDIWDDHQRGACWLPAEVFQRHGFMLTDLQPGMQDPAFEQGLAELIGVAKSHLRNALRYTLLIPRHETGIRKFCLWALGMAVLTLRKINNHRDFNDGKQVKISRNSVKATILVSNLFVRSDGLLERIFAMAVKGLPDGSHS